MLTHKFNQLMNDNNFLWKTFVCFLNLPRKSFPRRGRCEKNKKKALILFIHFIKKAPKPIRFKLYSDNDLKSWDKSYSVIIKYLEWTGLNNYLIYTLALSRLGKDFLLHKTNFYLHRFACLASRGIRSMVETLKKESLVLEVLLIVFKWQKRRRRNEIKNGFITK